MNNEGPLTRACVATTLRVVCFAGLLAMPATQAADVPTPEEMWKIIQEQQKEIERLRNKLEHTEQKVEATGEMLEQTETQVSKTPSWTERTKIGGYGELHYNNLENDTRDTTFDQVDFHRFVLYFGHHFTDRIRFFSEVELEHGLSGDDEEGELELEQAYIDFDVTDRNTVRTGLYLVPVGILNETHEPTTFYGVERNPVETNIIPTTWWEAAIGAYGEIAPGWNYDLMVGSGLDTPTSGDKAFLIRDGRQKVSKASANDGAVTGRIRYTGIPGVELAVTGQYQMDVTQGVEDIGATLFSAHAIAQRGPFSFRALYARWDLEDGDPGIGPKSGPVPGRDVQDGWYVEPAYRFGVPGPLPGDLGVFARYNEWNNRAGRSGTSASKQLNLGFNYWPHPDVVFKFDYQNQRGNAEDDLGDGASPGKGDGFNLGLGYVF